VYVIAIKNLLQADFLQVVPVLLLHQKIQFVVGHVTPSNMKADNLSRICVSCIF
jgi:hypothetical protein